MSAFIVPRAVATGQVETWTNIFARIDHKIISELIRAALRLLPADDTLEGVTARREKERLRAAEALLAEQEFCEDFRRLGYDFVNQDQQQGKFTITPDLRFNKPTLICGHMCYWLEFKDFFGFRKNPFVENKNKKQLRKYAAEIGPGAIVYKLGFEIGHINIEGVKSLREQEVRQSLVMQMN
ncbi:hypothetical protein B7463_g11576, partial [Scytalidium lignicola]